MRARSSRRREGSCYSSRVSSLSGASPATCKDLTPAKLPLVDLSGHVIGIPTLAGLDPEFGGAQAPGIGFAIPSSTVQRVADRLIGRRQT